MEKKPKVKSERISFVLATLIVVCICALALGFYRSTFKNASAPEGISLPILNESTCAVAGGAWNACGSLCRALPEGSVCPAICVQQCECRVDEDCPFGYSCQQQINDIGICGPNGDVVDKK